MPREGASIVPEGYSRQTVGDHLAGVVLYIATLCCLPRITLFAVPRESKFRRLCQRLQNARYDYALLKVTVYLFEI